MNHGIGACLWTPVTQDGQSPCDRYKHASCVHRGQVYLLGGRAKCSLRDFWKYNVVRNEWVELPCDTEDAPEELEQHTMVVHQGFIYVFGGMQDSSFSKNKLPLWMFDTVQERWTNWKKTGETVQRVTPANRRGHTAVTFGSAMYVYGGYMDMRGSTTEFWKCDFDSRIWTQLSGQQGGPGPRHGHSAVAFQDCMYVYGGLQGLKEQKDLWKWSSVSQTWSSIRFLSGPSRLVGHSAVLFKDNMLVFGGGETQSRPQNSVWMFSFKTHTWEKLPLTLGSTSPCRIHHCSVGLGRSFQPSTSSIYQESPKDPNWSLKIRPFKNKCLPLHLQETCIELQTFQMDGRSVLPDIGITIKDSKLKGSCLTFENPKAVCEKRNSGQQAEETMAFLIPDLLLVLGGKPLQRNHVISVHHMTIA